MVSDKAHKPTALFV